MMHALFQEQGGSFRVEILADKPVQDFINAHTAVLDGSFQQVPMSEAMRRRLTRSDYIFSGIKTFHELNEAFPSLIDENGNRKPFEQFLNDVRKIDETYNANYLRAEYNFVQASATMAAKWEQFQEDGDRYNLQYRTAGDTRVRPAHAALNGVTLPPSDSFWTEYYPPNGWNCRCTVVQVRKAKYPATPHDEAMSLGEEALGGDKKGIFRFNSGKQQKTFPDYNPYTIRRCRDCDIAQGKAHLAFIPDNELCQACRLIRQCHDQQRTRNFREYRSGMVADALNFRLDSNSLVTGILYQTKSSLKRGISHARNLEELDMFAAINAYVEKLTYIRFSKLGEGKNISDPKDAANIKKKKDRGVTGYNVYELKLGSSIWVVKTEVYKNESEAFYTLYKEKER